MRHQTGKFRFVAQNDASMIDLTKSSSPTNRNGKDPGTVDQTVPGSSTKRERLENEKRNDVFAYMIQDKSKVVRGKMLIKYEVNKKSDLRFVQNIQKLVGEKGEHGKCNAKKEESGCQIPEAAV